MTKKYVSVAEAATMLNKTRQWIWLLIISGKLDAEKVGGRYIIPVGSLNQYIENNINKGDENE